MAPVFAKTSSRQAVPGELNMKVRFITFFSRGNNRQAIFVIDEDRYLFLDRIGQMSEKNRYIVSEPDPAISQQKSILKSTDPVQFLDSAFKVLQCDLERIKNCARISESDKLNRDILLYWLWQEGMYTNLQIGNIFGLTHSPVSRRVAIIREKMALEPNFQSHVEAIKSQIKPP